MARLGNQVQFLNTNKQYFEERVEIHGYYFINKIQLSKYIKSTRVLHDDPAINYIAPHTTHERVERPILAN